MYSDMSQYKNSGAQCHKSMLNFQLYAFAVICLVKLPMIQLETPNVDAHSGRGVNSMAPLYCA